jgi:hypothetical protein
MIYLLFILLIISAIANSIMDTLQHHYSQSVFSKLKPNSFLYKMSNPESWKNKYKEGNPDLGDKFFGSTTIFVWITDLWHFCKMIMINSLLICIGICCFYSINIFNDYNNFLSFIIFIIIMKLIYGFIFEIFYNGILIIK